jgi:hypothetical protein
VGTQHFWRRSRRKAMKPRQVPTGAPLPPAVVVRVNSRGRGQVRWAAFGRLLPSPSSPSAGAPDARRQPTEWRRAGDLFRRTSPQQERGRKSPLFLRTANSEDAAPRVLPPYKAGSGGVDMWRAPE